MTKINSRRQFLRDSAIYSSALAVGHSMRPVAENHKLNLAFIGAGGRASRNISGCDIKDASGGSTNNIVALCDVNKKRAAKNFKKYRGARRFADFRRMFDSMADDIDAVVISTPDHTHFAATMAAMQLGKHVYVEKPLAHSVWELRTLKKAAAHYGVITQMGNQGHTTNGIRLVKEWYEAGVLGEVKEVIAWFGAINFNKKGYFLKPEEFPPATRQVPAHVSWDLWLGPRSPRQYTEFFEPRFWRGWYDFGSGLVGDWSCHTLDAPFWALQLGMPHTIESISRGGGTRDFVCDQSHLKYHFSARGSQPAVTLEWYEGLKPPIRPEWHLDTLPRSGMIMVGSKCSLMTGGRPNQPHLLLPDEELQAFMENPPDQTIPRVAEEDPQGEWIRAIKGEGPMCLSSFDYAADLTEVPLLGAMAQRMHTTIEYDAQSMTVTNHAGFEQLIREPVREGWAYGADLW